MHRDRHHRRCHCLAVRWLGHCPADAGHLYGHRLHHRSGGGRRVPRQPQDQDLESKAGWKGLIRKGETLLIVLVACQLDAVIGGSFVRDAAIIGFSANEAISIVENAGLMGLPIPAAITKAIDILKQRAEMPEKGKD